MNDEKAKRVLEEAERMTEIRAALKEHAAQLREVADRIDEYLAGRITADHVKLMFELSPAGDGSGCDNYYVPVSITGWKCPDAVKLIDRLERFPERLKDILWEGDDDA